jgi:hypothetical protein
VDVEDEEDAAIDVDAAADSLSLVRTSEMDRSPWDEVAGIPLGCRDGGCGGGGGGCC